jgi:hypothetical protein
MKSSQVLGTMTSIIELNDLGEYHLRTQLMAYYFACSFNYSDLIKLANKNIANDKNYLDLKAEDTKFNRAYRIEFTKDHLKFKEKE